jgi:ATP-dependent DNA helicase RecG
VYNDYGFDFVSALLSQSGRQVKGGRTPVLDKYIAEATDCDFKVAVELNRPKSWLKTVSAFADGIGGTFFFGVDDEKNVIGLPELKKAIDSMSKLIKERITPLPEFIFMPVRIDDSKDIIMLKILPGEHTPYYYNADGVLQAYVRLGSDSVPANAQQLNRLVLKG